jgi:hypothetical protein
VVLFVQPLYAGALVVSQEFGDVCRDKSGRVLAPEEVLENLITSGISNLTSIENHNTSKKGRVLAQDDGLWLRGKVLAVDVELWPSFLTVVLPALLERSVLLPSLSTDVTIAPRARCRAPISPGAGSRVLLLLYLLHVFLRVRSRVLIPGWRSSTGSIGTPL